MPEIIIGSPILNCLIACVLHLYHDEQHQSKYDDVFNYSYIRIIVQWFSNIASFFLSNKDSGSNLHDFYFMDQSQLIYNGLVPLVPTIHLLVRSSRFSILYSCFQYVFHLHTPSCFRSSSYSLSLQESTP